MEKRVFWQNVARGRYGRAAAPRGIKLTTEADNIGGITRLKRLITESLSGELINKKVKFSGSDLGRFNVFTNHLFDFVDGCGQGSREVDIGLIEEHG